MIDDRKLDSFGVLASGILGLSPLKSNAPKREIFRVDDECPESQLKEELESKVLEVPEYYGLFRIWKSETGYGGELMQYRQFTDTFENVEWNVAYNRIKQWYAVCCGDSTTISDTDSPDDSDTK